MHEEVQIRRTLWPEFLETAKLLSFCTICEVCKGTLKVKSFCSNKK